MTDLTEPILLPGIICSCCFEPSPGGCAVQAAILHSRLQPTFLGTANEPESLFLLLLLLLSLQQHLEEAWAEGSLNGARQGLLLALDDDVLLVHRLQARPVWLACLTPLELHPEVAMLAILMWLKPLVHTKNS